LLAVIWSELHFGHCILGEFSMIGFNYLMGVVLYGENRPFCSQ
jgi:hypothetical protein